MNPFMPHVTEELWHALRGESNTTLLSLQKYPLTNKELINSNLEKSFDKFFEMIRLIRNLRIELGLKPSQEITVYLVSPNKELLNFLDKLTPDIKTFTKAALVYIKSERDIDKQVFAKCFSGIIGDLEVFLPFEGLINLDSLKERLTKDLNKVNNDLETLNKRISNKNFIDKAPINVVQECKNKFSEAKQKLNIIQKKLDMFK